MRALLPLVWILTLGTGLAAAAQASAADATRAPRRERVPHCSWDRPGHNPFMGDVVAAIDRYSDIPTAIRVRLKQRMQARQYDEIVDIRRDSIRGRVDYEPTIRDMHFGLDRVCHQVSRSGWSDRMHERGLVYCEQGHCILIPTVCRNVSRIERRAPLVAAGPAAPVKPESLPPAETTPPVGSTVVPLAVALAGPESGPSTPGPAAGNSFWFGPWTGLGPTGGGAAGRPALVAPGFASFGPPGGAGDRGSRGSIGVNPSGPGTNTDANLDPGTGSGVGSGAGAGAGAGVGVGSGSGTGTGTGTDTDTGNGNGNDPDIHIDPDDFEGVDPGSPPLIDPGPAVGGPGGDPFAAEPPWLFPVRDPAGSDGPATAPLPGGTVPEPATWLSLLVGLIALAATRARREPRR